jgi:hypothetical protein
MLEYTNWDLKEKGRDLYLNGSNGTVISGRKKLLRIFKYAKTFGEMELFPFIFAF